MKANTPELMKFKRLQRKLGESRRGVIGLLEAMWIEVSRNCPKGDIGRFTDEEIAIMVDWEGDPALLVESLIECRWLDRCQVSRLVVHDWIDHCPNYVKGGLAKREKNKTKNEVQANDTSATSSEVQANDTSATSSEVQANDTSATSSEVASTKPSQAKPNQANSSQAREANTLELAPENGTDVFGDPKFQIEWERWKRHRVEKQKPIGAVEEESQLYDLVRFGAKEATAIVRFSLSRGALNLITNGDHKQKSRGSSPDKSNGSKKQVVMCAELMAHTGGDFIPNYDYDQHIDSNGNIIPFGGAI